MVGVIVRELPFQFPSGGSFPRNVTYTLTSSPTGLMPKAAFIVCGPATANDTITGSARISVGMTDGTTQRSVGYTGEDATATANADTASVFDTGSVLQMPSNTGGGSPVDFKGSFQSFGTDSITIQFTEGSNALGNIWFFYGDEVTADVQSVASSSSIGGTVDVSMSFLPDCVIAITTGNAFVADGSAAGAMLSVGSLSRTSSTQSCTCVVAEDQKATNTSSGTISRDDAFATKLSSSGGTVTEGTRLEGSFPNSTGFRITTRNAAVSMEAAYLSLRVAGLACWSGAPTIAASSAGSKSSTAPGFRPQALFAFAGVVATINTVGNTRGSISVGGATVSEQGLGGLVWQDAQTVSVAQSIHSEANFIDLPLTASTHDWIANQTSFDATGFTLTVSDAAAADRPTPFLAIENPNEIIATDTEQISDVVVIKIASFASTDAENISDQALAVVTFDRRVVAEIVQIGDDVAIVRKVALSETEQISDVALLITQTASTFGDTEQIAEAIVTVLNTPANAIVATDTERINDAAVLVQQTAFTSFADTERIGDQAILIPGRVLVASDIVDLIDEFNSGAGTIAIKLKRAGRVFQW